MRVCVCVCVRERERERQRGKGGLLKCSSQLYVLACAHACACVLCCLCPRLKLADSRMATYLQQCKSKGSALIETHPSSNG